MTSSFQTASEKQGGEQVGARGGREVGGKRAFIPEAFGQGAAVTCKRGICRLAVQRARHRPAAGIAVRQSGNQSIERGTGAGRVLDSGRRPFGLDPGQQGDQKTGTIREMEVDRLAG